MKKSLFGLLALSIGIFSSCSNDEIKIDAPVAPVTNALSISVDLSNFYSSYVFDDTYHNVDQIAEAFRTFNSEHNKLIQVRTYIYNKDTDELVDSIVKYINTTNAVTESKNLLAGNYYAITTVCFADAANANSSWWKILDREKLSTAKLYPSNRYSKWSVLSQSAESFTVSKDSQARINTTPQPLGALIYMYMQNFQYIDEASFGTVADNKIRKIALYTQRKAESYNIDPNATSKFNYYEETGSNTWYTNKAVEPDDFDSNWTFFKSNLYSYYYVMEPSQHIIFGYMLEGSNTFNGYGEQNVNYTSGQTYLAYWDYFKVGNPYLGIADNNHWNSYKVTDTSLFEEPYTSWGASLATVKAEMATRGYELLSEEANYLLYSGKKKERYSSYDFNESDQLYYMYYAFESSITLAQLEAQVKKTATYYGVLDDGSTAYISADKNSAILIYSYTFTDGSTYNFVEYDYYSETASAPSRRAVKELKTHVPSFVK